MMVSELNLGGQEARGHSPQTKEQAESAGSRVCVTEWQEVRLASLRRQVETLEQGSDRTRAVMGSWMDRTGCSDRPGN